MDGTESSGVVASVNVGGVREVSWLGRRVRTAIFKHPVDGRRRVEGVLVAGDAQANLEAHGGPTKSVYAYAAEDYDWWARELGRDLPPGQFGENLTVRGLDVTGAVVGERWRVGDAVLRVTEPRVPCFKLGMRMDDAGFPRRFAAAGRPGSYLGIERPGDVGAGDRVQVVDRPDHGVTVGLIARTFHGDRSHLERIVDAPQLSDAWRQWARTMLDARARQVRTRRSPAPP